MKMYEILTCVILLGFGVLTAEDFDPQKALQPEMNKNSLISVGSKTIKMNGIAMQYNMSLADTMNVFMSSIFNMGKGDLGVVFFTDRKREDLPDASICRARITAARGETRTLGDFTAELRLQKDGRILISNTYKLDPGVKTATVPYFFFRLSGVEISGYSQLGNHKIPFDRQNIQYQKRPNLSLTFFPEEPARRFQLIPINYSVISINRDNGQVSLQFDRDGKMEFLLDLRGEVRLDRSNEFYSGVDFLKIDSLRLPSYPASRNLIMNPSFEFGFRYFPAKSYGGYAAIKDFETYSIDDTTAHFGRKSLKITCDERPIASVLPLSTMGIPCKPGERYQFSFYAKTDAPGKTFIYLDGRGLSPVTSLFTQERKLQYPDNDWKRFVVPFDARSEFNSVYFTAGIKPGSDIRKAHVWIDGLQLEQALSATDFTTAPVQSALTSNFPGNCFDVAEKPGLTLEILAAPGVSGKADISVKDFFDKEFHHIAAPFTADKNGHAVIPLPELERKLSSEQATGAYVVTHTVAIGDQSFPDYSRFSVIHRLNGRHKNRNIFNYIAVYTNNCSAEGIEQRFRRFRDIGVGSLAQMDVPWTAPLEVEKGICETAAKYNIEILSNALIDKWNKNGRFGEDELYIENIREITDPTPEQLKLIEEIAFRKAKKRPWIKVWFIGGELEGFKPFITSPAAVGKVQKALYCGVKRGNPEALVHTGGTPWNVGENGREWMKGYLKILAGEIPDIRFDGTAIHTYQTGPENPDLDKEIHDYIEMLRPFGYADSKIYFDEGMNYFSYTIPGRSMSPYSGNSGNAWYIGMLSYDTGKSEKMAAAFTIRHYLPMLKYAKNAACANDFSHLWNFFDYDLTMNVKLTALNVLANILGDADYRETLNFAPNARCYLFENKGKIPTAVVWGFDPRVDAGTKPAPVFRFEFKDCRIYDFMGRPVTNTEKGPVSLALGPWPYYVTGAIGTGAELAKAFKQAENQTDKRVRVEVNAMPVTPEKVRIQFNSASAAPLPMDYAGKLNGLKLSGKLLLAPEEKVEKEMAVPAQTVGLKQFNLELATTASECEKRSFSLSGNFMIADSDKMEADKVHSIIPAIHGELSVRSAVSNGVLHLFLEMPESFMSASKILSIHPSMTIDNWLKPLSIPQEFFVFEVRNDNQVFAHWVPPTQADSGSWTPKRNRIDPRIKAAGKTNGKGRYLLALEIPKDSIMPLTLAPGSVFGLNILIGNSGRQLQLAPVEGFKNPGAPGQVSFVLVMVK